HGAVLLGDDADAQREGGAVVGALEAVRGDQSPAAGGGGGVAPFGFRHPLDGQSGGLGGGGGGFQIRGRGLGGIVEVEVGEGAAGEAVLRGEAGVRVFGRQPGHGHGPLHEAGAGGVGQVGGGDGSLAAADENAQAEVAALLALDVLEPAVADADGEGGALGAHRLGGIGAGPEGGGDQISQDVGGGGVGSGGHAPIWPGRPGGATGSGRRHAHE